MLLVVYFRFSGHLGVYCFVSLVAVRGASSFLFEWETVKIINGVRTRWRNIFPIHRVFYYGIDVCHSGGRFLQMNKRENKL